MSIIFLFGAGASRFSGECFPTPPPLGTDLFSELIKRGGIFDAIDDKHRPLFENFEEGMDWFRNTHNVELPTLLREMSEYFVPFELGSDNLYRTLVNNLAQRQSGLRSRVKQRIVLATTNYDLLLEQAILNTGCILVYPKNPDASGDDFTYPPKPVLWQRHTALNSYWAQYRVYLPLRPAFELLKVHGSCNFLLNIPPTSFEGVRFQNNVVNVEAPVNPTLPANKVLDHLKQDDSLAPAISMYTKDKQVLFGHRYVAEHQARFQSAVADAAKIFLVGIRISPQDQHIWDHIAASRAWLGYVGGEPDCFRDWCEKKRDLTNHCFIAKTFEEALPNILRELDDATR